MSRLARLAVLFLVVVLQISTSKDSYTAAVNFAFDDTREGLPSSHLSEKDYQAFWLFRSGESISGTANSYPVPDFRYGAEGTATMAFTTGKRLEQLAVQYILRSSGISPALSIREILYPFHFFW